MSFVQAASNQTNGSTTVAATLTGVTAGNLIVVGWANGWGITGITDSSGDTVVQERTKSNGAFNQAGIAAVYAAQAGTHTITVTSSVSNGQSICIAEYGGGSWTLEAVTNPASQTSGTSHTSDSLTPAGTGRLAVAMIGCEQDLGVPQQVTWGGSFTWRAEGYRSTSSLADYASPPASSLSATATTSGSTYAWDFLALFVSSGGGGSWFTRDRKRTYLSPSLRR